MSQPTIVLRNNFKSSVLPHPRISHLDISRFVHDLNNLMFAASGRLEIIKAKITDESLSSSLAAAINALEAMQKEAVRLSGRLISSQIDRATLEQDILDTMSLFVPTSNIQENIVIAENIPPLRIGRSDLWRVLSNLFLNAAQATDGKGPVAVDAIPAGLGHANDLKLLPGIYGQITIKDQGPGIPEKELRRVFEDGFTTKDEGNGLGLGIVKSTLVRHGGQILAESSLGRGTKFIIYLPAFDVADPSQEIGEKQENAVY